MNSAEGPFWPASASSSRPTPGPRPGSSPGWRPLELKRWTRRRPHQARRALPGPAFVLAGSIRVYARSEGGREIACTRGGPASPASVHGLPGRGNPSRHGGGRGAPHRRLPAGPHGPQAPGRERGFRDYMLGWMAERLSGMMEIGAEVAFSRLDARLERWLSLEAGRRGKGARPPPGDSPAALGSSREVVSRILKDWEGSGRLDLSRGGLVLKPGFPGPPRPRGREKREGKPSKVPLSPLTLQGHDGLFTASPNCRCRGRLASSTGLRDR
jgi:CRP/FNR family transcriptional regulator